MSIIKIGRKHLRHSLGSAYDFIDALSTNTTRKGSMASRMPVTYDDFDDVDGTLIIGRKSPTGHLWSGTAPGAVACYITSGRMYSNTGNAYMLLQGQNPIYRMGATFSFTPVSGGPGDRTNAKVVFLALPSGGSLAGKLFHLQIMADSYIMQQSAIGGPGLTAGTFGVGQWNIPLTTDGTPYTASFEIDYVGRTATIYGPDGSIRVHAFSACTSGDVGIAVSDNLNCGGFQFIGPTSYNTYYHSVETGPSLSDRQFGRAAAMGALAPLYGSGFSKIIPFKSQLIGGGNAWYSVFTTFADGTATFNDGTISNYMIAGRARFDATDGGYYTNSWEIDANGRAAGYDTPPAPTLSQRAGQVMYTGAPAVSQARLSASILTPPYVSLDLFVPAAVTGPVTVTGIFEGYCSRILANGLRNANAFGTTPATLNFANQ